MLDGVAVVALTLCGCTFRFPQSADRLRGGWLVSSECNLHRAKKRTRLVHEVVEQGRVDGRRELGVGVRLQLGRDERRGRARCRVACRRDQVVQRSIQSHSWVIGVSKRSEGGAAPLVSLCLNTRKDGAAAGQGRDRRVHAQEEAQGTPGLRSPLLSPLRIRSVSPLLGVASHS